MIPLVFNLKDAESYFLGNSSWSLMCEKENWDREEVSSYPEAEKFFNS